MGRDLHITPDSHSNDPVLPLPVGCTVMENTYTYPPCLDLDLALDLARLGGSNRIIKAAGGQAAVDEAYSRGILGRRPPKGARASAQRQ